MMKWTDIVFWLGVTVTVVFVGLTVVRYGEVVAALQSASRDAAEQTHIAANARAEAATAQKLTAVVDKQASQARVQAATLVDLNAKVASGTKAVAVLENTLSGHRAQIAALDTTLSTKTQQLGNINTELATKTAQYTTLDTTLATRAAQIATLDSAIADKTASVTQLDGNLTSLHIQLQQGELQLTQSRNDRPAAPADKRTVRANREATRHDRPEKNQGSVTAHPSIALAIFTSFSVTPPWSWVVSVTSSLL
jgi:chromosome segregation ATPase